MAQIEPVSRQRQVALFALSAAGSAVLRKVQGPATFKAAPFYSFLDSIACHSYLELCCTRWCRSPPHKLLCTPFLIQVHIIITLSLTGTRHSGTLFLFYSFFDSIAYHYYDESGSLSNNIHDAGGTVAVGRSNTRRCHCLAPPCRRENVQGWGKGGH